MNECIWKCACGWKGTVSEMVNHERCPVCQRKNHFSFVEYNRSTQSRTDLTPTGINQTKVH